MMGPQRSEYEDLGTRLSTALSRNLEITTVISKRNFNFDCSRLNHHLLPENFVSENFGIYSNHQNYKKILMLRSQLCLVKNNLVTF